MHLAAAAQSRVPPARPRLELRHQARHLGADFRPRKERAGGPVERHDAPLRIRDQGSVLGYVERGPHAQGLRRVIDHDQGKSSPLLRDVLHAHLGREQLIAQMHHALPFHATRAVDQLLDRLRVGEVNRLEEVATNDRLFSAEKLRHCGRACTNDFMRIGIQQYCRQR